MVYINSERLQARLLREETLTLEKAISLSKADEESRKQLKDLTKEGNDNIDSLENNAKKRGVEKRKWSTEKTNAMPPSLPNKSNGTCGQHHPKRCQKTKSLWKMLLLKECTWCGWIASYRSWQSFCWNSKPEPWTDKTKIKKDKCFVTLDVWDTPLRFKVDTGSQANIIPVSMFRKFKEPTCKAPLQTSKKSLTSYTGDKLYTSLGNAPWSVWINTWNFS